MRKRKLLLFIGGLFIVSFEVMAGPKCDAAKEYRSENYSLLNSIHSVSPEDLLSESEKSDTKVRNARLTVIRNLISEVQGTALALELWIDLKNESNCERDHRLLEQKINAYKVLEGKSKI